MGKGSVAIGVVMGLVVGAVAGAAGFAMGAAGTPEGLDVPTAPTSFPIVLGSFDDARQVTVVPTSEEATMIAARAGGIVNDSSCRSGGLVDSGTAPWSIAGNPVLALATRGPLYRDLRVGVHGPDVEELQDELVRLGYDVDADGRYGPQTGQAVSALRVANGLSKDTALALADVAWLPATRVTISECARVGSLVSPGEALGQVNPGLVAALVSPLPQDLVPGARTLTIEDLTMTIDGDGAVGQADLAALAALPVTGMALETAGQASAVQLSGRLVLADPLETATVPASAVITDGGTTCVATGGSTTLVEVVSSQIGQSVITFGEAAPPSTVDIAPDPSLTCG